MRRSCSSSDILLANPSQLFGGCPGHDVRRQPFPLLAIQCDQCSIALLGKGHIGSYILLSFAIKIKRALCVFFTTGLPGCRNEH